MGDKSPYPEGIVGCSSEMDGFFKSLNQGEDKMPKEEPEIIVCFDCGCEVDPMHNFECEHTVEGVRCNNPLCRECWKKDPRGYCPACRASV